MKKHLFTIICLCASLFAAHPQNARNGYEVSPNGMLRILVVFADVVDDPDSSSVPGWNAGQLPRYKDSIIDPSISTSTKGNIRKDGSPCGEEVATLSPSGIQREGTSLYG